MALAFGSGGGGGGAVATKSYLSTSQAVANVHPPTAGSLIVFDFPADGQSGSDVTLSADGKTFTLVNSGIYSVLVQVTLSCTLADTLVVLLSNVVADAADPFTADGPDAIVDETFAAGASVVRSYTLPAMWWTGGSSFTITQSSAVSNTNALVENTIAVVSRVL